MPQCLPIVVALVLVVVPAATVRADTIPGPINARVVSVYDGDSLTVDAVPWPGLTARTKVRVAGVDTPEIRGKCQTEKDMNPLRCPSGLPILIEHPPAAPRWIGEKKARR